MARGIPGSRPAAAPAWPPVVTAGLDPGAALAAVAEACLHVREEAGPNRGPEVDWLIARGGGPKLGPGKAGPPWCAWAVGAWAGLVEEAGHVVWRPMWRGLAVGWWLKAPAVRQITRDVTFDEVRIGDVLVRTRGSKPPEERERVLRGVEAQGHIGVVTSVDAARRRVEIVAGNSSGFGHDTGRGSGGVRREAYVEGDKGWARIVGFVRVAGDVLGGEA